MKNQTIGLYNNDSKLFANHALKWLRIRSCGDDCYIVNSITSECVARCEDTAQAESVLRDAGYTCKANGEWIPKD